MEKAYTLPEHGESLSAAEFWQVTIQWPWQGQSSGKGRGRVWRGRLPSFLISSKRTKAHLAFSTIQSSIIHAANWKLLQHKLFLKLVLNVFSWKIYPSGWGYAPNTSECTVRNCLHVKQKRETHSLTRQKTTFAALSLLFSPLWCTPLQEFLEGKAVLPA